jgi:hypothetical protein
LHSPLTQMSSALQPALTQSAVVVQVASFMPDVPQFPPPPVLPRQVAPRPTWHT